jgi:hypothetical protein
MKLYEVTGTVVIIASFRVICGDYISNILELTLANIPCYPSITDPESASCHVDSPEQPTIAEEMVQTKVSLGVLI